MFEEVPLNLSFCDRGSAIFYVHSYIYSYIFFFFAFLYCGAYGLRGKVEFIVVWRGSLGHGSV